MILHNLVSNLYHMTIICIIQHFYSVYCKSVQSSLRNIDKHFQERIKSKQEEQQKVVLAIPMKKNLKSQA